MEAVELSIYFGVPSGCKYLRDEDSLKDIYTDFHRVAEVSNWLQ